MIRNNAGGYLILWQLLSKVINKRRSSKRRSCFLYLEWLHRINRAAQRRASGCYLTSSRSDSESQWRGRALKEQIDDKYATGCHLQSDENNFKIHQDTTSLCNLGALVRHPAFMVTPGSAWHADLPVQDPDISLLEKAVTRSMQSVPHTFVRARAALVHSPRQRARRLRRAVWMSQLHNAETIWWHKWLCRYYIYIYADRYTDR